LTFYSLDRLLDGNRLYCVVSTKRPIVREQDEEGFVTRANRRAAGVDVPIFISKKFRIGEPR
jgi:hypothetical protein